MAFVVLLTNFLQTQASTYRLTLSGNFSGLVISVAHNLDLHQCFCRKRQEPFFLWLVYGL